MSNITDEAQNGDTGTTRAVLDEMLLNRSRSNYLSDREAKAIQEAIDALALAEMLEVTRRLCIFVPNVAEHPDGSRGWNINLDRTRGGWSYHVLGELPGEAGTLEGAWSEVQKQIALEKEQNGE